MRGDEKGTTKNTKDTMLREPNVLITYTAKYVKTTSGYMGQLVEWPEVVTEGKDIERCQAMLEDALREMILAYKELNKELPLGNALMRAIIAEV